MRMKMDKRIISTILVHVIGWTVFVLLPIFVLESFSRISRYVPLHYYLSFMLLIPFFYISNHLIKQKKAIRYLSVMAILCLVFYYLPVLVGEIFPSNDFNIRLYDIKPSHQAKVRMGTSILLLITWAFSIITHFYKLRENARRLEEENMKVQLSLLKSQINPHFFFNSLNAIYYLAMQKSDNAPRAIITLSDMMRYVLTDAKVEYVYLNQEIEYLDKYIELQKMRIPEKTKLKYTVSIDDDYVKIAPLIFIPFVENAFKFGISANQESEIRIIIIADSNQVSLFVENQVFANTDNEKGTRNGLINVRKRLDLMYPGKYTLTTKKEGNTFTVKLLIMLDDE
ncbi:hypothetical protein EYV94_23280 [Puteibacter caeruleilacunae]|nr:hypothetical protein EYV94_23280 [Puteibacter caeruleilacunae]